MDTKINGKVETMLCTIAAGTVIEVGDLVGITAGLIVKAGATTPKIARAMEASASGDVVIEVSKGKIDMIMDGDGVFAVAYKGTEVDISIDSTKQEIDVTGGTTYKVLLIDPSQDAGVVGSADDIKVKINRPLDEMVGTA